VRLASGESVDANLLPVHCELTIFKPKGSLQQYFERIAEVRVCSHFALVHADIANIIQKVAYMLRMKMGCLTS